ncbi:hypothetical protein H0248_21155 [Pectobacterium brasiliense]|uniref:Uncharacterized protein n=1 Tax=Pectobacterium brasiliense TaxID=180957 RepID=A0AAE2WE53_9GAMM|nr:hypothetical protein [Pectobacterium brasiliense]MBA0219811.1 hypothetical protein [Pectobacterium brasiliense]MBN3051406.1 hypothetical protein [Pectobacterium brasiliense]
MNRHNNKLMEIPADYVFHENHNILHPVNNTEHWGEVKITSKQFNQLGGKIFLRAGKHIGPHKGFGVRHIWSERGAKLTQWGFPTIHDVPRFVSEIIVHQAGIVCEFPEMGGYHRVVVLRGRKGCAVLAAFDNPNDGGSLIYSVVTAYRNINPNGTLVAQISVL